MLHPRFPSAAEHGNFPYQSISDWKSMDKAARTARAVTEPGCTALVPQQAHCTDGACIRFA